MARKKIREYDSKRLFDHHLKRLSGIELHIRSAQITESTDISELPASEPWLSSEKLVVKPDMLFGKCGKSGVVGLNLHLDRVASFVKDRIGKEVEIGGCKGPVTTFIVEPFVPHTEEFYLSIVSDRLGCSISFSECGGIEIEENWDKVGDIDFPIPFGRIMSATEKFVHGSDEKCATANPEGRKRALLIGREIANFTDVAATFNGVLKALREKETKLKAARMHIYVNRGGPNYQIGRAKMLKVGEEIDIPLEVYGPEMTMTGICKQAIRCITAAA